MVFIKEKPCWGKGEEFLGPRHLARLKKIISLMPEEKGIFLDGAVGLGILSEKLQKKGYKPFGIDLDIGAVFYCKKKGITSIMASLENLPFREGIFPLVISSETLEHLEDHKKALVEFYRVMKKGGFLIVSVPLNENLWSFWDDWAGHKRRFSPYKIKDDFLPFKIKEAIFFGFPFIFLYDILFLKNFIKKRGEGKIKEKEKKKYVFLKNLFKIPLTFLFSIYIPLKKYSPNLIIKLEKS